MAEKYDQIRHDLPDFDAAMRKLVRVPKKVVERAEKRKEKKRKVG
jgi:hypothetical protein